MSYSALLISIVVGVTDGDTLTARCQSATDVPAQTIKVNCNGAGANAEQVRAGMAWAYPRYVTDHRLLFDAGRSAGRPPRPMVGRAAGGAMGMAEGERAMEWTALSALAHRQQPVSLDWEVVAGVRRLR